MSSVHTHLMRPVPNSRVSSPSDGGKMSKAERRLAMRMKTEFSPKNLPGHMLIDILFNIKICSCNKKEMTYRRPKPNTYVEGSTMFCVGSKNRSGMNTCGSYFSFGSKATALQNH